MAWLSDGAAELSRCAAGCRAVRVPCGHGGQQCGRRRSSWIALTLPKS